MRNRSLLQRLLVFLVSVMSVDVVDSRHLDFIVLRLMRMSFRVLISRCLMPLHRLLTVAAATETEEETEEKQTAYTDYATDNDTGNGAAAEGTAATATVG